MSKMDMERLGETALKLYSEVSPEAGELLTASVTQLELQDDPPAEIMDVLEQILVEPDIHRVAHHTIVLFEMTTGFYGDLLE